MSPNRLAAALVAAGVRASVLPHGATGPVIDECPETGQLALVVGYGDAVHRIELADVGHVTSAWLCAAGWAWEEIMRARAAVPIDIEGEAMRARS